MGVLLHWFTYSFSCGVHIVSEMSILVVISVTRIVSAHFISRNRLNQWLIEQGKTPSKYSTLLGHKHRKARQPLKDPKLQQEPELQLEKVQNEEENLVLDELQQLLSECLMLLDSVSLQKKFYGTVTSLPRE